MDMKIPLGADNKMRKLLIILFTLISFNVYASPYANPWLYDKMLDFIQNPSAYQDNFTNGIMQDRNPDVIVGAFIENAYSVYEKEEEFTAELKSCGDKCYQDNSSADILQAYHKFFYIYATVLPVSEILIQNPAADENISYYIQNKLVSYIWENKTHLVITINEEKLEFKQQKNSIIITTSLQILKNYILN